MFQRQLSNLIGQLNEAEWPHEVATLKRCRRLADLERLAESGGGWISKGTHDPRVKLVRHGSGTFLVVKYVDGWSTRLAMQAFPTR